MRSHDAFLATLAREYYLDNTSKVQLAKRHGISRFQVARFLDEARRTGVVRIEILDPTEGEHPHVQVLAGFLGLEQLVIAPASPSPGSARDVLANQVAAHLRESVTPGMRLGVAWSRTLAKAIAGVHTLPRTDIVQLAGAVPLHHRAAATDTPSADTAPAGTAPSDQAPGSVAAGPDDAAGTDGVEFIGRLAALAPGRTSLVWAPLVVENATTAASLRRQPEIAQALGRADRLDMAYVALGSWQPGSSTVYDVLGDSDRKRVAEAGAVVEFCGRVLTACGAPVRTIDDRVIGVELAQLRAAKRTVGIALGAAQAPAVMAAAASGIFTSMILDHELAAELMRIEQQRANPAAPLHQEPDPATAADCPHGEAT